MIAMQWMVLDRRYARMSGIPRNIDLSDGVLAGAGCPPGAPLSAGTIDLADCLYLPAHRAPRLGLVRRTGRHAQSGPRLGRRLRSAYPSALHAFGLALVAPLGGRLTLVNGTLVFARSVPQRPCETGGLLGAPSSIYPPCRPPPSGGEANPRS